MLKYREYTHHIDFRDIEKALSMAANFNFWIDVWPLFLGLFEIFKGILLYPFPASRRSLQGEVALITGANGGVGWQTARTLALQGCQVYIPLFIE